MKIGNVRQHLNHGAFSLLNRLSIVGFAFVNVLLIVRMIPKATIGVWVLYTTITALNEMIRTGFVRNPFIITLVNHNATQTKDEITGTSLFLHILLALFTSIIFFFSGTFLEGFWSAPGLSTLFRLYALQNLLLVGFLHIEYIQTASLKFHAVFFSNLFRQVIPSIFIVVAFFGFTEISLDKIAIFQIVGTITGAIFGYFYITKDMSFNLSVRKDILSRLTHFGKFTLGTNISSTVLRSTDSWMLGRLASPAAVAIYNPALKLANIFEVPTLSISNFIFPQIAQRMKESGASGVREIYMKSVSLILALTIPIVTPLYFFSDFFVSTIFGPDYIDSSPILKVTVLYSLIIPFNRQYGTTMDALSKPKLNFYLLVLATIANAVLNYFFLDWFGIIGCAYATLLSYILLFVINQTLLYRMFKVNTLEILTYLIKWYVKGYLMAVTLIQRKFIISTRRS